MNFKELHKYKLTLINFNDFYFILLSYLIMPQNSIEHY